MAEARRLIDRYFSTRDSELAIDGSKAPELADHYGTPFFVYDHSVLERKWEILRHALPAEFSICYSVKANPSQMILRYFLSRGAGLEVASAGEFHQAIHAGCPADRIIFAGPGKTEAELAYVLREGIGEIHVESALEARRIADLSGQLGIRAPIAVRVNPGDEADGGAMRMGGRPAPFGIDEEDLGRALDLILSLGALDFRGIHLFSGTQILDPEVVVAQYRIGITIARRVAGWLRHPLRTLDFGGGLGIPYFAHESELDMDALRSKITALLAEFHGDPMLSGTQFIVEPGRYLVGEAGIYIARVNDVKVSRGKKFVIVDGGMNHHLAASGNLGQTIKRNYPVAVLNRLNSQNIETVDIVGPLCTPLDILARAVSLPVVEVGDLIGVFQSGAYARSASPLHFLGHRTPAEVWVEGEAHQLIRRKGQLGEDLIDQCMPQNIHRFYTGADAG